MEQQTVDIQALNGDFGATVVGPTAETWRRFFAPETLRRLRDVKRRYEPDGLINANHNISLA